ncbi:MAG TPA: UDP-N-acetylmuramoyl-L-alanine--D-glutamate ligase, partial [Candidatus Methylacidiphilales bacterium]
MVSDLVDFLRGKEVLLWGFGKEGRSSYRFLRRHFPGKKITVADAKLAPLREELAGDSDVAFLEEAAVPGKLAAFDLALKSPGVPTAALGLGPEQAAKITGQADLFLRFAPGRVAAVTGTKGKSTTSHLLRHLLAPTFPEVRLGGNIG